jgi:glycosyltransferase involved in cell wall biosynthesis
VVGGAEVQQSFLAVELASRGYDVSMISMDYGQIEGERVRGVRLIKMHAPDAGVPVVRFIHPRFTSVWSAMKRANADLYYQRASGALTGFVAAFAERYRRHSMFAGAHDFDFVPCLPLIPNFRDRLIYKYGISRMDRIVVQSERQREACRNMFGRSAIQINSCYALTGKPGAVGGVVLWVATIKSIKRPELFVELARRMPQYRFKMVGGVPHNSDYLRRLRESAHDVPNLELTGFVPYADVEEHFDGVALLVSTSSGEGFPNTFLQAWSRGIPTISFFEPGVANDGRSVGLVVANVQEMVEAVVRLKDSPAYWSEIGDRVRRHFELHHGVERIGDAYQATILEILRSREH